MKWNIKFFNDNVKNETHLFPKKILAKLLNIFDLIEEFGPNLGKPHTDSLGDGLFEIRAKGEEGIGRSLFCYVRDRNVMILHSFIKKTQKTPKQDLELALRRKKEIENENV